VAHDHVVETHLQVAVDQVEQTVELKVERDQRDHRDGRQIRVK